MIFSRRKLSVVLSAIVTGPVAGQNQQPAGLDPRCYLFDKLAVKRNTQNGNEQRAVLNGETHIGAPIELHITTLAPGRMPHPDHQHVHEEMIMIQDGTLDVTIAGRTTRMGPGSVAYVSSNVEHGWKNAGETSAQYFVLAIGKDDAG